VAREFLFIDSYPEDHDGEEVFITYATGDPANDTLFADAGTMHEPPPYTGELDWGHEGESLALEPGID
jgi:hypothetical protein